MSEDKKNKEGHTEENQSKAVSEEEVVEINKNEGDENEDVFTEGQSIEEVVDEDKFKKARQNYIALIILLAGALIGSLFVDVVQFFAHKGYSPRALKDARIFTLDGKTWVAYDEPVVKLKVFTVSEDELKDCPTCKPPQEVIDLLTKVLPTLDFEEVDINSEEGKKLVEEYDIKTVPTLIFSDDLEETDFYNSDAKVLFNKLDDDKGYSLNLATLGLPSGKYIETPVINEGDQVLGNKDAPVKVFLYSDFQCPYCAQSFDRVVKMIEGFGGDKVALVYKDLPLDFHGQAVNSAMAGQCAGDQGKFWEMSKKLYATQKKWENLSDDKAQEYFVGQAKSLGLDENKFKECLKNEDHKEVIEKSKKEAEEFGINGTPSLFVNEEFIPGAIPLEELKKIIIIELDKASGDGENNNSSNEGSTENK